VSHHATLHGPSATLRAIEHTAAEAGYTAMTVSVERFDPVVVRDAVDRLRRQGVDGLVIMAPHIAAIEAVEQLDVDVPVVTVHGRSGASPAVLIDQDAGARRATELLLSLGHASVWHLAGPQDWLEAAARTRAWADALRSRDLEPPPVLIGDWSAQSGYELGRRLLEQREVSAVFAANDQMALGLYRAAHEQGRRVPHDLSIVGFDDIAEAAYFSPPLTTVRQDFAQVGRWSLELLVDQLEHDTPVVTRLVDADLVVRDSTAPPPG
jgi:DNA-binding LacI/PurR family transcriptional regulator